jgi:hypothetical protein
LRRSSAGGKQQNSYRGRPAGLSSDGGASAIWASAQFVAARAAGAVRKLRLNRIDDADGQLAIADL